MATKLSAHFTLEEFGGQAAPAGIQANLKRTAEYMEAFRGIIGLPFVVTSGYRTPQHNAEVGGSETSDHVNGLACDGYFSGATMWQVYNRLGTLQKAGGLPPFDQIIFYPNTTNHVHFGFGSKMRSSVLAKQVNGSYSQITDAIEQSMPGWGSLPLGVARDTETPTVVGAVDDEFGTLGKVAIAATALAAAIAAYLKLKGK